MTFCTPRLIGDTLIATARRNPDKTAVYSEGQSYSYDTLLSRCLQVAAELRRHGVQRGERVVVFMNNTFAAVVSIYAAILNDAVFVVANPQTKTDKLRYILEDCGAAALCAEAVLARTFGPALDGNKSLKAVICDGRPRQPLKREIIDLKEIDAQPALMPPGNKALTIDLAALIYTSGSTGQPKGVMQTHQSMLFAIGSLTQYLRLSAKDKILCVLPLAFDYGLYQLLMSVALGATLILERSFLYPGQVFKDMSDHEATVFPGVPTIFSMLTAAHQRQALRFPAVRRVTNTAAALPENYLEALAQIFPEALIYKMYGLTECKRVCYLEPELIRQKPDSVGKAIPGTEMMLRDDKGTPVPPGQTGTLYVRGPHVMLGYWNKPELSAKMLKPGLYPGEKLLCTHDLFYQDEEGFFYFVGRNDDIIKSRGEKVSPAEVEAVLYGIEGIKDAAVVGRPDDLLGESICAFIAPAPGASIDWRLVKKACLQRLEDFMVPKHIIVKETLPKSANAKIDKKILKKWAAEMEMTENA